MQDTKEKVYDISENAECDVKEQTVCKMRTALGMAADMSGFQDIESVHFQAPSLQKIFEERRATKSQMVGALKEWQQTLPADRREEGSFLVEVVQQEVGADG